MEPRCRLVWLWNNHVWLTRQVIRDAADKNPCLDVDLARLHKNQDELGENFARLTHNRAAGEALARELHKHIDIAVEIVQLANQNKDITEAYNRWKINAMDIARVYSVFHRRIRYHHVVNHMLYHLSSTLEEATAILSHKCAESDQAGDRALNYVREMSEYLASTF